MAPAHDDAPEVDDPLAGLEAWLDARLRNAPGWSVSVALHAVVLGLLATLSVGAGGDGLPGEGLWISLAPRQGPTRLEVLPGRDERRPATGGRSSRPPRRRLRPTRPW
jgi:hypothetical protein